MALPLSIDLQARLDAFEQQMNKAGDMAEKKAKDIEEKFAAANPHINLGSLFAGGAGGLAAALGLDAVQKLVDHLVDANKQMADLGENAKRVGLSTDRFQELRFAAGVGGVSDADFASGIETMAKRLNDAVRDETELTKLLDANDIKWKNDADEVLRTDNLLKIAADLIKNAKTELDKLKIADMLGVSKEWIKSLEPGGAAFMKIADSAKSAGVIIDRDTIQKADDFSRKWNASTATWSAAFKAQLSDLLPVINQIVNGTASLLERSKSAFAQAGGFGRFVISGGDETKLSVKDLEAALHELEGLKKDFGQQDVFGLKFQLFDTKGFDDSIAKIKARLAELKSSGTAALATAGGPLEVNPDSDEVEKLWVKREQLIDRYISAKKMADEGDSNNFFKEDAADAERYGKQIDDINAKLKKLGAKPAKDAEAPVPYLSIRNTNGTTIPETDAKKDAFDLEEERLKRSIALREAEAASIGQTEAAREAMRAEILLLQAAEKAGDDVTVDQITTYAMLRSSMGATQALEASGAKLTDAHAKSFEEFSKRAEEAGAKLQSAKTAFQGVNDATKFVGNQAVDVIDGLINKTETWGQAVQNTARLIEKELLRAALTGEGAFAKLLGTSSNVSGSTGGIFGMIAKAFSGGFGGLDANPGSASNPLPGLTAADYGVGSNAGGTDDWRGGATWVGENGPEIINAPRGAQIIPNDVTRSMSPSNVIHFSPVQNIDARGSQMSEGQFRAILAENNKKLSRQWSDALPAVMQSKQRLNG